MVDGLYHLAAMNRIDPKKVVEEGYNRIGEAYARGLGAGQPECLDDIKLKVIELNGWNRGLSVKTSLSLK